MAERRTVPRDRTLLGAKIVFNSGRSTIDCVVRNLSADGASVQVESAMGLPTEVQLVIANDAEPRPATLFGSQPTGSDFSFKQRRASEHFGAGESNGPLICFAVKCWHCASLDQFRFGIVLLDNELRAQFINRPFVLCGVLPDAKAESRPAFVALLYHGRDTCAYEARDDELDEFIAQRVALVKAGDQTPVDLACQRRGCSNAMCRAFRTEAGC